MIEYQWDEAKRQRNLELRALDFRDAWRVYEDQGKITLESPYADEQRFIDMAEVNDRVLLLVYTLRGDSVRCISFRYASRKERRLFDERREDE